MPPAETITETTFRVEKAPVQSHPPIPEGLKASFPEGPDTHTQSKDCPVVRVGGLTYWAFSYVDNRTSLGVVAYDAENNAVGQWEVAGTRYLWKITLNRAANRVTFHGQGESKARKNWAALAAVETVASDSHPEVPDGMKATFVDGPDDLKSSATCPVVRVGGVTYWAYSYRDNRVAFGIVAYDTRQRVVGTWEAPGARYLWKITLDAAARSVTFHGQANAGVTRAWKDLVPVLPANRSVVTVDVATHPAIPPGLKATFTKGPDSSAPSATCSVIKHRNLTYWAFSYVDNRVSFGVVAYDQDQQVVGQWEAKGGRYLWDITIDKAAKTVTFHGQSNKTATMTFDQLKPS